MATPESNRSEHQQNFVMRLYNEEDYAEALDMCTQDSLFIGNALPVHDALLILQRAPVHPGLLPAS